MSEENEKSGRSLFSFNKKLSSCLFLNKILPMITIVFFYFFFFIFVTNDIILFIHL